MNLKNPIDLFIFHHTDETDTMQRVGVDYPMDNAELRKITFYTINAVSQFFDDGNEYASIHTNGSQYICPMTKDKLNELIKKHL